MSQLSIHNLFFNSLTSIITASDFKPLSATIMHFRNMFSRCVIYPVEYSIINYTTVLYNHGYFPLVFFPVHDTSLQSKRKLILTFTYRGPQLNLMSICLFKSFLQQIAPFTALLRTHYYLNSTKAEILK